MEVVHASVLRKTGATAAPGFSSGLERVDRAVERVGGRHGRRQEYVPVPVKGWLVEGELELRHAAGLVLASAWSRSALGALADNDLSPCLSGCFRRGYRWDRGYSEENVGSHGVQEGRLGGTGLDSAVMAIPLSHPTVPP